MQDNHFARLVRTEIVALKKSSVDFVTSFNVNLKGGNQNSRQIIHFERGPIKRQQAQQRRFPAQNNSSPPRPPHILPKATITLLTLARTPVQCSIYTQPHGYKGKEMRQPSSKGASTQHPQITSLSYAAERDKKKLGAFSPLRYK